MMSSETLSAAAERLISRLRTQADEFELNVGEEELSSTRFARSCIHQNVSERSFLVSIRLNCGGRIGTAAGNQLGHEDLDSLCALATEAARRAPPDPDWPGVSSFEEISPSSSFDEETASCSPNRRAKLIARIFEYLPRGALAFGGLTTGWREQLFLNSNGVQLSEKRSVSEIRMTAINGLRSGYSAQAAPKLGEVKLDELTEEAATRASLRGSPVDLRLERLPVILSPYAVARLLEFVAFLGFSGSQYSEGRSFMKLGQSVTGELVSIWDDGGAADGLPISFDVEGTPKTRVDLITNGIATGLLYDRRSARKAGMESSGHAVPQSEGADPYPANLFMAPGQHATDDLVGKLDSGVWLTRLHYVNILDPSGPVLTGVTRDGTLLVKNGRIEKPANDVRFRTNVLEAFASAIAVGKDRRLQLQTMFGSISVPPILISSFALGDGLS